MTEFHLTFRGQELDLDKLDICIYLFITIDNIDNKHKNIKT